jgi:hypothetical protein
MLSLSPNLVEVEFSEVRPKGCTKSHEPANVASVTYRGLALTWDRGREPHSFRWALIHMRGVGSQ